MNELSSDGRALVNAARDEAGLGPEERARLRARVLATASAAGTSLTWWLFAKAAAAKAFGSSGAVWGVLAATVTVVGAVTATHVLSNHPGEAARAAGQANVAARPIAPSVAPSAAVTAAPSPAPAGEDELHPSRQRSAPTRARVAPSASAGTGFAEDARLLRDVRVALAAGEGDRALSLLEAREANKTSGVFAEEREAAKIVTLCALGRQEAHAAAARFLTTHGSSPLAERVRRACAK